MIAFDRLAGGGWADGLTLLFRVLDPERHRPETNVSHIEGRRAQLPERQRLGDALCRSHIAMADFELEPRQLLESTGFARCSVRGPCRSITTGGIELA